MRIIPIVENTVASEGLLAKHGLCLYIETRDHKMLMDLGPNDTFIYNAATLGIDLTEIDMVVLTHGHADHVGGLKSFLSVNDKAKIYLHRNTCDPHFLKVSGFPCPMGIDLSVIETYHDRFVFTDHFTKVDGEITLFAGVTGRKCFAKSNDMYYVRKESKLVKDNFSHEQNMLLTNGKEWALVAGCAHNGILNILERAVEVCQEKPNTVLSGFHLYNEPTDEYESDTLVKELGEGLLEWTDTEFYTYHCTGTKSFEKLKEMMGDKLHYFSTGQSIELLEEIEGYILY